MYFAKRRAFYVSSCRRFSVHSHPIPAYAILKAADALHIQQNALADAHKSKEKQCVNS